MILLLLLHCPPSDSPPACSWSRVPLANLLIGACWREEGRRRDGAAPQVSRLTRPEPSPPRQSLQSVIFPTFVPINFSRPQCPDFFLHCETLAGTIGELIDAYNFRDIPVKNIIASPTMSGGTQWVRVEIGLSKTLLRSTDRKKIPC